MKRKIFWTLGIVLVLLALLVVVPLTMDWGRFKPQVLAAVESATGRKVTIDGDLSFRLLPTPRLMADRVRVASLGAAPEALIDIDRLGIGVALRPLFDGKVEAKYVHLDRPRVNLITYADGTTNWTAADAPSGRTATVSLEDIRISNGSVVRKDMQAGGSQTISGITAKLSLPDLNGPVAFDGGVIFGKLPVQAKGTYHDGALDVVGQLDGGLADFTFKGRVGASTQGALTATIADPAALQAQLSRDGVKSKAPALAKPLTLSATITKAPGGIRLENLLASIDASTFQGALDVALAERTTLTGNISVNKLVTRNWSAGGDTPTEFPYKLELPAKIDADMKVALSQVVLARGSLQNVAAHVRLKMGTLSLERTSLVVPGAGQLSVAGTVTSVKGFAQVAASLSGTLPQVKTTLAAFGITSVPPVADSFSGSSTARLISDTLSLSSITATLDSSHLAGSVTAKLGKTRDMDVTLTADALDADRLQARLKAAPKRAHKNGPAQTVKFNIAINNLKSGGRALGRVAGVGVYKGAEDAVTFSGFDIANAAGYRVRGTGSIAKLTDVPETELSLVVAGQKMSGTVALTGPQSALRTQAKLDYAGAAVEVDGTVNAALASPAFQLNTKIRATELTQVLNRLAAKPDPKRRPMGALALSLDAIGTTASAKLNNVSGSLGPVTLSGFATVALNRAKPDIQGNFVLGDVPLRAFLGSAEAGAVAARADATDRWSRDALDFSSVTGMTGKISLTAKRLTFDTYIFDSPRAMLVFDGTGLAVDDAVAQLFGGNFTGKARISGSAVPDLAASFAITGVPLQKLEESFMASQPASGTAKISGSVVAQGASQYAMVQNLSGSGNLASEQGIIKKISLRRVNDRMKELGTVNDFIKLGVTAIQGGETAYRYLQSDWAISRGVVTVQPVQSDMDGGNVSGKAIIDLPRWQVASTILIKLDDFTQAPPIGMTMNGPLTAPVTKYDFFALQKYFGVRAANAGLKAIVKGEGFNPKDLLGIGKKPVPAADPAPAQSPSASGDSAPAAAPQASQAAAPKTPEQELKDTILQGIDGLFKKKKPPAEPAPDSAPPQ